MRMVEQKNQVGLLSHEIIHRLSELALILGSSSYTKYKLEHISDLDIIGKLIPKERIAIKGNMKSFVVSFGQ